MRKVRKAVIPVAGLGTRFLPATKAMPKEMLTIVDRPVVQYAVDEALEAGIEHIVFVTGRNKHVIEDYFDVQPELVDTLTRAGKMEQLASLSRLQQPAGTVSFTRQQAPHGLGHAVWCARDIIGDEPFALLLPDMVSFGDKGCLAGVMELYEQTGGNVLARRAVRSAGDATGTVSSGKAGASPPALPSPRWSRSRRPPQRLPTTSSTDAMCCSPRYSEILDTQDRGAGDEIQLTDAMLRLSQEQAFFAHPFEGRMFDCGSKDGFIQANVAFALARDDIRGLVLEPIEAMIASQVRRSEAA